jgi:DNA-binding HxlR family transcriptional regulator
MLPARKAFAGDEWRKEMAKRRSLKSDDCPMARALDVIGDQWSLLIVRDAFDGMRRFGEFQASLGIARNILTERLRSLVAEEVLELAPASDGTAFQEYVLTPKGEGLFAVVVGLRQWAEDHLFAKGERHSKMIERKSGRPIQRMVLRSADGQPVAASETYVKKLPAKAAATN